MEKSRFEIVEGCRRDCHANISMCSYVSSPMTKRKIKQYIENTSYKVGFGMCLGDHHENFTKPKIQVIFPCYPSKKETRMDYCKLSSEYQS